MSRKKQNRDSEKPEQEIGSEKIVFRKFEAPQCYSCIADRPPNTNASKVTAKRGKVRYIKCRYCNRSWSVEGP